jgi:hypothetical protein
MDNIKELTRLNPTDKPAIDTDYGQWLIENHSQGWHMLDDLKAYMVDRGLTPYTDFMGETLGTTLRAIHDITFTQCRIGE